MQRKKTFLVVCISIVILGTTQGQNNRSHLSIPAWNAPSYWHQAITSSNQVILSSDKTIFLPGVAVTNAGSMMPVTDMTARASLQTLKNDYYTTHFGFFCQKELEFEKKTHIPLRFRLGSLEQCNYLEGKR